MKNISLMIKEIQDLEKNSKDKENEVIKLRSEKINLEIASFNKNKKIKEQEVLITSLRANIKGLTNKIKELNRTSEIKEVKSMEINFKQEIVKLQNNEKELLIKVKRLQNKNTELSVKAQKREKVICELQKLIKEVCWVIFLK